MKKFLKDSRKISGGFLGGTVAKNPPANAGDAGSIPGLERSPQGRNGNPLQGSCLENPINRVVWWVTSQWGRKE